jgi:UDP-N-acetylglucosamine 1-carboxyvinyltransferase
VDKFVINGGRVLSGTVNVSGAKNATLALMPATLLASGTYRLSNTPVLRDVTTMSRMLESMGLRIELKDHMLSIDSSNVTSYEASYEHVKKMRASIYVLGPLVSRFGSAKVSLPGGCAWGPRPVNLHIEGIQKLGAEVTLDAGYIVAKAKRLQGARITFDVSSVGATGNLMMAATLAKGTTIIENAAIEPEITQLANFLVKMGAKIQNIGTNRIEIEGVAELHPSDEETIPDRIEAGTFLIAGAIAGGRVRVESCDPEHLAALLAKLEDAGAQLSIGENSVELVAPGSIHPVDVTTAIYPGFPTDLQAQWIALMSIANGSSVVKDSIYFDRFKHVPELNRLGTNIELNDNVAVVKGMKRLKGARVMSTDLRASASLILAGLVAEGTTEVLRVYHIDRGYEKIEQKLRGLGADIKRVAGKEF